MSPLVNASRALRAVRIHNFKGYAISRRVRAHTVVEVARNNWRDAYIFILKSLYHLYPSSI